MISPRNHLLTGVLCAAVSAIAYSTNTPLSSLVFAGGGSAMLVVVFRAAGAVIISSSLLRTSFNSRSESTSATALASLSVLLFAQGGFYVASVAYIPVSLAALIFFTWPVWVGLMTILSPGMHSAPRELIYFAVALIGLTIALQADFQQLDSVGMVLALAGALSMAAYVLLAARFVPTGESPLRLNLFINAGIVVCAVLAFLCCAEFHLTSSTGIIALLVIIAVSYTIATLTQLLAIRMAGASVAALFFNIEPVSSILLAIIILDESLSGQQLIGGTVVILTLTAYTSRKLLGK